MLLKKYKDCEITVKVLISGENGKSIEIAENVNGLFSSVNFLLAPRIGFSTDNLEKFTKELFVFAECFNDKKYSTICLSEVNALRLLRSSVQEFSQ